MKRIKILLIAMISCIALYAQTYTPAMIQTPNGSWLFDTYYVTDVENYNTNLLSSLISYISSTYNGAEVVGLPSQKYNCHAYAWHVSEGGEEVWMGKDTDYAEDVYWNDGSYIEVSEADATKVSYNVLGNHSAIRINSNWYQSKWGSGPLVKHHPNDVPSIYHAELNKKYYVRCPSIMGTDSLCGTEEYNIANYPSNAITYWTIQDNPNLNNTILERYPYEGRCVVNIDNGENINDTLVAVIQVNSGQLITLKKKIQTGWKFNGTYSHTANLPNYGAKPLTAFHNGSKLWVGKGCTATIQSPYFANATISHTNALQLTWNYDNDETITVSCGMGDQTITVIGGSDVACENFRFRIYFYNLLDLNPLLEIRDGYLYISLTNEDEEKIRHINSDWSIEIKHAITGRCVYKGLVNDLRANINTSKWNSGVYLIQHRIGKDVKYQKIIIK